NTEDHRTGSRSSCRKAYRTRNARQDDKLALWTCCRNDRRDDLCRHHGICTSCGGDDVCFHDGLRDWAKGILACNSSLRRIRKPRHSGAVSPAGFYTVIVGQSHDSLVCRQHGVCHDRGWYRWLSRQAIGDDDGIRSGIRYGSRCIPGSRPVLCPLAKVSGKLVAAPCRTVALPLLPPLLGFGLASQKASRDARIEILCRT